MYKMSEILKTNKGGIYMSIGSRVLICMDSNGLENALLNTSFKPSYGVVEFIKQEDDEKEPTFRVRGDDGLIYEGVKSCFYTQKEFDQAINQFENNQKQIIQTAKSRTAKLSNYKFAISKIFSHVKPERSPKTSIQAEGKHGTCYWSLDNQGTLRIAPPYGQHGVLANQRSIFMDECPWMDVAKKVKNVIVEPGVKTNKYAAYLFARLVNCEKMDLRGLDMSGSTTAEGMFRNCKNVRHIETENLRLGKDANQLYMFAGCDKLDLGDRWKISREGPEPKKWEPPRQKESVNTKNHDELTR
jgi:hypothetical protein